MKTIVTLSTSLLIALVLTTFSKSLGLSSRVQDDRGEVVGLSVGANWRVETPPGMVKVPGGTFTSGPSSQDGAHRVRENRKVALSSFYMDRTETTNSQYRQFIASLQDLVSGGSEQQDASLSDVDDLADTDDNDDAQDQSLEMLKAVGAAVLDKDASKDEIPQITQAFIEEKLCPDKSVWQRASGNRMADPMTENYFEHPAFDDFPVVGISWGAASAYAVWRTYHVNDYRASVGLTPLPKFRLPTSTEWEYAARGGKELAKYPWGGPYLRSPQGKVLANFKSGRGNYGECGYSYTSPVTYFPPNDYGLYDMAGNVAEWTLDAYGAASSARGTDINPRHADDTKDRKVIKGGSWKDVGYFLETGAIDYNHKDEPQAFIGFRCVMPQIGVAST